MRDSREAQEELALTKSPAFSALVGFNNNETKQTELIASLLRPNGMHGQGILFLRHFLTKAWPLFEQKSKVDFHKMKVHTEIRVPSSAEMGKPRRLDLVIDVDRDRQLVVESKARDAADQWKQVTDYVHYISNSPNSRLIYLSWDGNPPEERSIEPAKWREELTKGRVEAYCYSSFIGEWLEECKEECQSARVKFFIEDLQAFTGYKLERLVMPPEIEPLRPLLREPLDDQQELLARDTLLTVALLGDHIVADIFANFQLRLRVALEQRGFICTEELEGLVNEKWGLLNARLPPTVDEDAKSPLVTIQHCERGEHNQPSPHFVLGIRRKDLNQERAELRRWQGIAAQLLGKGNPDGQWIWQEILEGLDNLHSKDALVKLLDFETVEDVAKRMRELLVQYHAIAEQVAG
jgi:hypothetical protein